MEKVIEIFVDTEAKTLKLNLPEDMSMKVAMQALVLAQSQILSHIAEAPAGKIVIPKAGPFGLKA